MGQGLSPNIFWLVKIVTSPTTLSWMENFFGIKFCQNAINEEFWKSKSNAVI